MRAPKILMDGDGPHHGGSVAAVSGNLARSTAQRFPGWGRCVGTMGTSAPNVPTSEMSCFVSVTDTMGTLGTLGTFSGLSFICAPLSHVCVYRSEEHTS